MLEAFLIKLEFRGYDIFLLAPLQETGSPAKAQRPQRKGLCFLTSNPILILILICFITDTINRLIAHS